MLHLTGTDQHRPTVAGLFHHLGAGLQLFASVAQRSAQPEFNRDTQRQAFVRLQSAEKRVGQRRRTGRQHQVMA